MSRSLFKGPLISSNIRFKKINKKKKKEIKPKIFNKNLMILPEYLDQVFLIYIGKHFKPIKIKENMIGYKFGEFLNTRVVYKYKKK